MNVPSMIYITRWLIRDTFRQALAGRLFWILLGVSGLCILFCLGISIEGGDTLRPEGDYLYDRHTEKPLDGPNEHAGKMNVLFGLFRFDLFRDAEAQVHFLQVIFATWIAGALGLLMALVWTAGFLPDFLQPRSASVLLAKPVPRWMFLVGKYIGVVLFVGFQACIFFLGTWIALGLKTGIWPGEYLLSIFIFLLHFAVLFSVSILLAVCTRSTITCVIGSVLFWVLCFAMNYGRHAIVALPHTAPEVSAPSVASSFFVEVGYWILPKPADMIVVLEDTIRAAEHQATISGITEFRIAEQTGNLDVGWSMFASLLAAIAILALSAYQFRQLEY